MPEHIRALAVVLFLAAIVFTFASQPAAEIIGRKNFVRRRNLWITLTLAAFLAHNFWIFALLSAIVLLVARNHEPSPVALFFSLLFILPPSGVEIPGFGLVNYFFTLSYQRLLALVILVPAYIALTRQKGTLPFGRTVADKFLAAYLLLIVILALQETTFTDTLRQIFYQIVDVFLPYYVISRSLRSMESIREAMFCFVLVAMILALIALFESIKYWQLYTAVEQVLGIKSRLAGYGSRAGYLRAGGSVGTIPLGYLLAVAIGFYLYVWQSVRVKYKKISGLLLLLFGLIATLSRGPWVGAMIAGLIFTLSGKKPLQSATKLAVIAVLSVPLLILLPGTDKFVDLLPYFGTVDQGNVTYREKLLENSLKVINRNPFFGSNDFMQTPEMLAMKQGQGIIDIVNTYIRVALESGYVGLLLFSGFFLSIGVGVFARIRRLAPADTDQHQLGRALLFSLAAILVTIFTVSSVSIIPIVYWSVAGLGAAYINAMKQEAALRPQSPESLQRQYAWRDNGETKA